MTALSRFSACPLVVFAALALWPQALRAGDAETKVLYDRDVRPILADNCYACHGPDAQQRKAKLRLDTKEGAFAALRDGGFALVPGKPQESRLLERISASEPSQVMPPPKTGKHLTMAQIDLL